MLFRSFGYWLGLALIAFGVSGILKLRQTLDGKQNSMLNVGICVATIAFLLATYWRPLGFDRSIAINLIFVGLICGVLLGGFYLFRQYYSRILTWALEHKLLFLSIPTVIVVFGFMIMRNTGQEFMPSLNEGSFLLMPTSLPHAGVEENKRVVQQLDMAVATIPEIQTVVGKREERNPLWTLHHFPCTRTLFSTARNIKKMKQEAHNVLK